MVSTHLKNILVKLDHFPKFSRWKFQKYLKPPPPSFVSARHFWWNECDIHWLDLPKFTSKKPYKILSFWIANSSLVATVKKKPGSPTFHESYWLVHRDSYVMVLKQSLYNWVVVLPLYDLNNQFFFLLAIDLRKVIFSFVSQFRIWREMLCSTISWARVILPADFRFPPRKRQLY